jgi:hypothetical protein
MILGILRESVYDELENREHPVGKNTQTTGWTRFFDTVHSLTEVPSRRLEDRIRELCHKAVTANDPELADVISELQSCLRDHAERLRQMMILKLSNRRVDHPPERRAI